MDSSGQRHQSVPPRLFARALILAGLVTAAACRPDAAVTAPEPTPPVTATREVSAVSRRLTSAEIRALLASKDSGLALIRTFGMAPPPSAGAAHEMATATAAGSEDQVTAWGRTAGSTVAVVDGPRGWASYSGVTKVIEGFARSVHAVVAGTYTKIGTTPGSPARHFRDGCGGFPFDQECEFGTIFMDLECWTENGGITVRTNHWGVFFFPEKRYETSDSDKCSRTWADAGRGGGNCDESLPGPTDPDCGSRSGDGGGNGSGQQYQPGDFTDGETVDWATGIGNGGESVCGSAAQVEYVCIDVWVETPGSPSRWETWSCGYATTC